MYLCLGISHVGANWRCLFFAGAIGFERHERGDHRHRRRRATGRQDGPRPHCPTPLDIAELQRQVGTSVLRCWMTRLFAGILMLLGMLVTVMIETVLLRSRSLVSSSVRQVGTDFFIVIVERVIQLVWVLDVVDIDLPDKWMTIISQWAHQFVLDDGSVCPI